MRHNHIITIKKHAKWILYLFSGIFISITAYHIYTLLQLRQQIQSLLEHNAHAITIHSTPTLSQMHLFGTSTNLTNLPLSNIPLTLQGISYVGDNKLNTAIITSTNTNTAKTYHQGDTIPYGATIIAILPNQVNIKHNGQMERMIIPQQNIQETQNVPPSLSS